ncbi:MAG: efflux RND transporter permease subunit [Chromatiales bacterium]|jgi:multidrug efflux pump subunit AcrB
MNITRIALDNDRLTLMLVVTVVLAGLATYLNMPRAYDPGFIIRTAQVVTYFPGASPPRVEELISSRLEDVVKEIPELDFVKSESRTGVSIVNVNIGESYKAMRPIWDGLRRKIDDAEGDLPEGVIGPFVNDEFGDVYGIVLAMTGEGFSYAELERYAERVQDALRLLPDAAKVEILGAQEERVFVDYSNARLAELGISSSQLAEALAARNIVSPGGAIELGAERIELEPSGSFETVADIGRTILNVPGSDRVFYLADIARVHRGYVDPPSSRVRATGAPALALAVSMREGGNNIELGAQVRERVSALLAEMPHGIELELAAFSPREVEDKVNDFVVSLVQAVAVVTAVMLLSLGLRTGIIVSALIPLAMLLALIVMSAFEIGLDQISLAALIIALGMLVDNGIVMSESIMVQMAAGKSRTRAALDSAAELRVSLLTASLTTAAAFLPIYLAESNVGEFTASLFKVVTITLLSSWVLALTVIPWLCVRFLRVKTQKQDFDTPFHRRYRALLALLLRHRAATLAATLGVLAVALVGFRYLPSLFFPPSDRTYFKVELEMPAGTTLDAMEAVVSRIEGLIGGELRSDGGREGVTHWISYVGSSGPRFILSHNPKPAKPNYALMIVHATSAEVIGGLMREVRRFAFAEFPDLDARVRRIENGPAIDNPVEVRISGDGHGLFRAADQVMERLAGIAGVTGISDDWGQRIKKIAIEIDQQKALRAGLTSRDIAVSLQAGLSGVALTEYREGEDVIPVLMRAEPPRGNPVADLEALAVYGQQTGTTVPLRQVADIAVQWEPSVVLRRDGVRTVTVGAQVSPGLTAAEVYDELQPWLDRARAGWGGGYRYELGGEAETSGKASRSIAEKLPVAAFIIVLLLVAQFNSIRKAAIVLATIPLSLIGVIAGLLLADSFFGFMTLLGVVSLAGIVINNAIVLLERIKLEIDEAGLPPREAIIGAAQKRMRPILLTTATTVLGLMPLYLGGGAMWEPMAIAIMGGLLFSTLLTLGVVPVLYALLFRVDREPAPA